MYLAAPEELLMERITASAERDGRYPAYITRQNPQNSEEIAAIFHSYYEARTEKYARLADTIVQTEGKSVSEITEAIAKKEREGLPGCRDGGTILGFSSFSHFYFLISPFFLTHSD
jgi:shikimate kinase